jgi:DNA replication ATP-dependent helicase Dna2
VQEEVALAASCVELALTAGLPAKEIAVISPYRAQNQAIRTRLADLAAAGVIGADKVVVDTVERMQGQERDLVVISLAMSDPVEIARQAEFLYLPNRLNVAVTRAKTKCIILGNRLLIRGLAADAAILRGTTSLRRLAGMARRVTVQYGGESDGKFHCGSTPRNRGQAWTTSWSQRGRRPRLLTGGGGTR